MTEKLREAAQQALKALDIACHKYGDVGSADTDWGRWNAASAALRAALAEQTVPSDCADSHQPAAWLDQDINAAYTAAEMDGDSTDGLVPLYTAPPKKLAEPEAAQEPVAWMDIAEDGTRLSVRQWSDRNKEEVPLYATPPQRPLLTDEEIEHLSRTMVGGNKSVQWLARIIERKVRGEKE